MDDEDSEGYVDDPNFIDSDNDIASDDDDVLYDRNVTDGIEAGLDGCDRGVEDELTEAIDIEVDDLEYPSSEELLSQCSSDEESGYRFPEFSFDSGMKNPHFEVGQLFSSAVEFREA